ncbi:hypothetical protein [Streptomyces scabiei]|uniref:hypothetical protein n=1 Tax=Streptomyces TaxID=1883 RepID=UPI0029BD7ADB|nr:hypothetical protein [Streptomyces scabiei]MDX3113751.1 hypothetical protein [Streptomyces scabiei]
MRGLPVRRIASTALCASLVLGLAAPAALAADGAAARERVAAASDAPVPGVAALRAQGKGLADLSTVLTPVTETLNTVLKADDGRLTPGQATRLGDAVKTAVAKITAATPAAPAAPAVVPPALAKGAADSGAKAAADPVSDALAAVQKALGDLLAAATSLDVGQVGSALTGLLDGLLDLLSSTLNGLVSLPSLPTLPSLPSLPAEAAQAPATPALPPPPTG